MKFRTEIALLKHTNLLNYASKITLLGSCFATHIGNRLQANQFDTVLNPFGIVFNPHSLLQQLNCYEVNTNHLLPARQKVLSLDFHSKYNGNTEEAFVSKISNDSAKLQRRLNETDVLFLTFGTAWVYEYLETGKIIANCQKLPSSKFAKKMLKLDDLVELYKVFLSKLLSVNPKVKIVLTVSPVRHIKDGLVENNRSKAVLQLLCNALESLFPKAVIYYPSYELVLDDLRDYRFFEKDLLHPNQMAVDYIFEHFSASFMSERTKKIMLSIQKYNRLAAHKDLLSTPAEIAEREAKLDFLKAEIQRLKLS
ncbi:MAG: GSCFA domain-containing protein [Putridiphycobacter sp.]|nr:GSCFA domain-containing protein [Putridiphycobacter sp.]